MNYLVSNENLTEWVGSILFVCSLLVSLDPSFIYLWVLWYTDVHTPVLCSYFAIDRQLRKHLSDNILFLYIKKRSRTVSLLISSWRNIFQDETTRYFIICAGSSKTLWSLSLTISKSLALDITDSLSSSCLFSLLCPLNSLATWFISLLFFCFSHLLFNTLNAF